MTDVLFITGTDTGVGKTWCTAALARVLVRAGLRVAVMKPVAAGAVPTAAGPRSEDALALIAASNVKAPYEYINPCCLPLAASPHIAAALAGVRIDVEALAGCAAKLAAAADVLLVEGAGGWLAPIGERETMADVARAMRARVVLVVGLRLGCLNHALLSGAAVRAAGLELAGWIANEIDPHLEHADENVATLARRLGAPLLGRVPNAATAALADACLDPATLCLAGKNFSL